LPASTTSSGCLGARFWGQVRGISGRLREPQGKGARSGETGQIAGKARYQALFPDHIAAGRILHGKEGVRVRQRALTQAPQPAGPRSRSTDPRDQEGHERMSQVVRPDAAVPGTLGSSFKDAAAPIPPLVPARAGRRGPGSRAPRRPAGRSASVASRAPTLAVAPSAPTGLPWSSCPSPHRTRQLVRRGCSARRCRPSEARVPRPDVDPRTRGATRAGPRGFLS
jgi:hypothetical protein